MTDDLVSRLRMLIDVAGRDASPVGKAVTVFAPILGQAADEIVRLRVQLHAWSNELQRVACHDEGFTPEYGWPIGDHVAETLASSILEEHNRLRAENGTLWAIVTDLADLPPLGEWCALCGWETNAPPSVRHAPGCLVGRARTAIKETPA